MILWTKNLIRFSVEDLVEFDAVNKTVEKIPRLSRVASGLTQPTKSFAIFEPCHLSNDVSDLREGRQTPDLEALKVFLGRSGCVKVLITLYLVVLGKPICVDWIEGIKERTSAVVKARLVFQA